MPRTQTKAETLVNAIAQAQLRALIDLETNFENVLKDLLAKTIELLGCEFGIVGELVQHGEQKRLDVRAISAPEAKFSNFLPQRHHVSIRTMETVFGKVLMSKQVVILNGDDKTDVNQLLAVPEGHPPILNFLGIPFIKDSQCIGMLAAANRDYDFSQEDVDFLQPFVITSTSILSSYQGFIKRKKAEEELQKAYAEIAATVEQLREAKDLADQAVEAKNQLIANISHDLRTPLNCIIGIRSLLVETSLTEEQNEYVNMIGSSADLLSTLVNDVLNYSKLELNVTMLEMKEFNLRTCVEDLLEMCLIKERSLDVEVENHYDENLPTMVIGDKNRLSIVIQNLLSNAIKFTDTGKIILSSRCISHSQSEKVTIEFSVKDTGIGIAEEHLNKLGTPFYMVNNTNQRGTGLGLAISKRIVAMMGGKLHVESTLGQGSTFWFSISFSAVREQEIENHKDTKVQRICIASPTIDQCLISLLKQHCECQIDSVHRYPLPSLAYDIVILDERFVSNHEEFTLHVEQSAPTRVVLNTMFNTPPSREARSVKNIAILTRPYRVAHIRSRVICKEPTITQAGIRNAEQELSKNNSKKPREYRVLVVDDNAVNRKVLSFMLKKANLVVDVAGNGFDAVEKIKHQNYDLIFMDLMMPIMDGFKASIEMRKMSCTSTIVVLSAKLITENDKKRLREADVEDYLSKPISFGQLSELIARKLK